MKATLSQFNQSPRKVRLVADLVRGKTVRQAKEALAFLPKKSAPIIDKLIASAVANAKMGTTEMDSFVVKTITVQKGIVLRRFKPMARGRAARVHRTRSIISLELAPVAGTAKKVKKTAKKKAEAASE
jgi:large subunit ribosomal protein L22